jgi:hypothetical protein
MLNCTLFNKVIRAVLLNIVKEDLSESEFPEFENYQNSMAF